MKLRDRIVHAWAAALVVALASGILGGAGAVVAQTLGEPGAPQPGVTEPAQVQPAPVQSAPVQPELVQPAPDLPAPDLPSTDLPGTPPPAATGAQMDVPEVAEGAPRGMPQLDSSSFAPQLVWLAITFVVLYLLMSRMALPRIGAVLDERKERISSDLDRASQLRQEAEAVLAEYEQGLAAARAEAQRIARTVGEEIAAAAAAAQEDLTRELEAQTSDAESRIAAAKQTALENVRSIALDVAQAAAAKLIGDQVTANDVEAAVDSAMVQKG